MATETEEITEVETPGDMAQEALADSGIQEMLAKIEAKANKPDEPEQDTTEPTEGDDDTQDQLADLAARHGLDPQLFDGSETVEEAQRFIDRMYRVMYREGEKPTPMPQDNGYAPAVGHETAAEQKAEELDLDLSDYDPDDTNAKNFKVLKQLVESHKKEVAALKAERDQSRFAEFQRQQQAAAVEFQSALRRAAPELFGTDKARTARQDRYEREAFEAGDILIRGITSSGRPLPPISVIAEQVLRMNFSDDMAKQKQSAKREAVEARTAKRSVGAPARNARNIAQEQGPIFEGPLEDDPGLAKLVKGIYAKRRA